jgi:hypothetical protein
MDNATHTTADALIPAPPIIRAALAKVSRESRRLRSLLRLAYQTEEDRQFVADLESQLKDKVGCM